VATGFGAAVTGGRGPGVGNGFGTAPVEAHPLAPAARMVTTNRELMRIRVPNRISVARGGDCLSP
jgi:hypothetical protein